jgi:hypothetical protein
MPVIKLDVDSEAYARLAERAVTWRRPVAWQAEVELRQALGLPFPHETVDPAQSDHRATEAAPVAATTQ